MKERKLQQSRRLLSIALHIPTAQDFCVISTGMLDDKIKAWFLLSKHSYLSFLMQNFGIQIIRIMLKNLGKLFGRKNRYNVAERVHKIATITCYKPIRMCQLSSL